MSTKLIPVSQICTDGGTQIRLETNRAFVDELVELADPDNPAWPPGMPPCDVFFDGEHYWLGDGFHREHFAREAGIEAIPCIVHEGTLEDARWFATSANKTHGLRRTNADKRRAVERALQLKPHMSDNAIAAHVGVHHKTVGSIRRDLRIPQVPTRTGRDGREINTSAIGKSRPAKEVGDLRNPQVAESGENTAAGDEAEARCSTPPAPAARPPEAGPAVKDALGVVCGTKEAREAFETLDFFESILHDLRAAQRQVGQLAQLPGAELLRKKLKCTHSRAAVMTASTMADPGNATFHSIELHNAIREIEYEMPYSSVCPYCHSKGHDNHHDCSACHGLPYVTKAAFERAPEGYKQAVLALAGQSEQAA